MDIRSQRTRQVITDSFLQLLQEKHISAITVTEICRMAKLNRATFYKHYLDIPDLQDQIEQELLDSFRAFLASRSFSTNAQYRALMIELINLTAQYGSKFYPFCGPNASSELPRKLFQLLSDTAYPILKTRLPQLSEEQAHLLYRYVSNGGGNVLGYWLSGNSTMSAEEIADFIMISSGAIVDAVAASTSRS